MIYWYVWSSVGFEESYDIILLNKYFLDVESYNWYVMYSKFKKIYIGWKKRVIESFV